MKNECTAKEPILQGNGNDTYKGIDIYYWYKDNVFVVKMHGTTSSALSNHEAIITLPFKIYGEYYWQDKNLPYSYNYYAGGTNNNVIRSNGSIESGKEIRITLFGIVDEIL